MNQLSNEEFIIMKNILLLAGLHQKSQESERNLLNKWFQDSVKTYIFESTAAPLIAKYLKLQSSADVKDFIHKQTDKNKPKYMGIIEQYFIQVIKYNQQDNFIQKLQQIILNPVMFTQEDQLKSYNTQKNIRKQFVCLLILRYFNLFGKQEIPSFYELWNTCFPKEIQKKKNSQDLTKFQQEQHSFLPTLQIDCSDQSNLQQYQNLAINQEQNFYSQKQQINNEIFEEDSYEAEPMNDFLNSYYNQYTSYQNEIISQAISAIDTAIINSNPIYILKTIFYYKKKNN
ncbi:hypothetical protein ABPG73_022960 [Tetrahymena malaccensis]